MRRAVLAAAAALCFAVSQGELAPSHDSPRQLNVAGTPYTAPRMLNAQKQLRPAALHAAEAPAESSQSFEVFPSERSGSKKCMCIVCALFGSCCCIMPIAQNLAQMKDSMATNVAGYVLSLVALLVPIFALLDVIVWSSLFSDHWKHGFSALGSWCGMLCLMAFVAGSCAVIQVCHLIAYALGKVGPLNVPSG